MTLGPIDTLRVHVDNAYLACPLPAPWNIPSVPNCEARSRWAGPISQIGAVGELADEGVEGRGGVEEEPPVVHRLPMLLFDTNDAP